MARVYIAGPMRGIKEFNFPAFDAAKALGQSLGWEVVSPADIDRESGFHEEGHDGNHPFDAEQVRVFATRDTQALLNFRAEDGDAVAMLPGWENSKGARSEYALAEWLGLKILDASTFQPTVNANA